MPDKPVGSDTFCVLPWLHRFTNIGGEIQVCCSSEEYDNNVRHADGRRMNIVDLPDDETVMNSSFMKSVRLDMLNGKLPNFCDRCRITEETGGISRRRSENGHFSEEVKELIERTSDDGTIPVKVMSTDLRLGNRCNLGCRMCSPRSSSRWIKEWRDVDQDRFIMTDQQSREFKSYDWYKSPGLFEQVSIQLPTLKHLHFAGGEPLIVPEMMKILEMAVESGFSGNIGLSYNTNITTVPPRVKALWPRFKGVQLLCSIDGFHTVNEFIRYPSRWATIDRNLRDLDRNFKEYGLSEVLIMCTLQIYNVFRLEELFDYLSEFTHIRRVPQLVDLHYPDYYRTQILPPKLKSMAKQCLERVLAKSEGRVASGALLDRDRDVLESLRGSIKFLESESLERYLPEFRRACQSMDSIRKQDVSRSIPELRELIDGGANA